MINLIDNLRKTRTFVLDQIKELSLEKLNIVPHGFNNNIIWNTGHLIAAQQTICYLRAGQPMIIPEDFYDKFKPGSRPERFIQSDEEDEVKSLLFSTLDMLEKDVQRNRFNPYSPWTTRTGISISNLNDALTYLHYHDGYHSGIIFSMKRLVQK